MTTWTNDELNKIGSAEELQIAPQHRDGRPGNPVTIWVVRVGDVLYVRSARGHSGAWNRRAKSSKVGHISAGGVEKDVNFVEVFDKEINDKIDSAYLSKYGRYPQYVAPMVTPEVKETTLRLEPRKN